MTDDEVMTIVNDMREVLGDLPHPEHEPLRFAYYVNLYRFIRSMYPK